MDINSISRKSKSINWRNNSALSTHQYQYHIVNIVDIVCKVKNPILGWDKFPQAGLLMFELMYSFNLNNQYFFCKNQGVMKPKNQCWSTNLYHSHTWCHEYYCQSKTISSLGVDKRNIWSLVLAYMTLVLGQSSCDNWHMRHPAIVGKLNMSAHFCEMCNKWLMHIPVFESDDYGHVPAPSTGLGGRPAGWGKNEWSAGMHGRGFQCKRQ